MLTNPLNRAPPNSVGWRADTSVIFQHSARYFRNIINLSRPIRMCGLSVVRDSNSVDLSEWPGYFRRIINTSAAAASRAPHTAATTDGAPCPGLFPRTGGAAPRA